MHIIYIYCLYTPSTTRCMRVYFRSYDKWNARRMHNKPLKYEVNPKLRDISLQQQRLTGKSNNHTGEPVLLQYNRRLLI